MKIGSVFGNEGQLFDLVATLRKQPPHGVRGVDASMVVTVVLTAYNKILKKVE
jgi:hypothetical protein